MSGRAKTFDAERHEYRIDGRRVPSVTQIVGDLLPCYPAGEWFMERGRAVHACAAMIAHGVEFNSDPQIDGQVRACRAFFADIKPAVVAVEQPVYSERYQYAGTLDMVATVVWMVKPRLCVIDYKAQLDDRVPYQLAGYSLALPEPRPHYGFGVQLGEDGRYKVSQVYVLSGYERDFLALRATWGVREALGYHKQEGQV